MVKLTSGFINHFSGRRIFACGVAVWAVLVGAAGCAVPQKNAGKRSLSAVSEGSDFLPDGSTQKAILLSLRDEMIRLDGEGLRVRANRPVSFIETTNQIAETALKNTTPYDFYRSFSRLNATYPNLHTHVTFSDALLKQISIPGPGIEGRVNVWLKTVVVSPKKTRLKIEWMADPALAEKFYAAEVIAINHRPLKHWRAENFVFCKRALRVQCDRDLQENLIAGVLNWKENEPLVYSVRLRDKTFDLPVGFDHVDETPPPERKLCAFRAEKYYPDFELVHAGRFACLFTHRQDASIGLLRIRSFQYNRVENESGIHSVATEVAELKKFWLPRAGIVKHLIIDVIGNGGGNEPTDYYRMLLQKPFVEQFVKFKKLPEMDDPALRAAAFWNEPAHELWFQKGLHDGTWANLRSGEFSAATPMFCPDQERPCNEGQFTPHPNEFRGMVHLMVDDGCISSCDGFVWQLQRELGADLYGFYPAADSAYSRWRIDVLLDDTREKGFFLKVVPQRAPRAANTLTSQDVVITLSTDPQGQPIAGKPSALKKFVPMRVGDTYRRDVLQAIIRDIDPKLLTKGNP